MIKDVEKASDVIVDCIRRKTSIIVLARTLQATIAETSRELGRIQEKYPRFRPIFTALKWPVNVNVGHIYIGSPATSDGSLAAAERDNVFSDNRNLSKFDYVIAEKVQSKPHYEVFEAIPVIQKLFKIGYDYKDKETGKVKYKVVKRVWLSKRAIQKGRLKQIADENHCNHTMVAAKPRIVYRRGRWLGTPNKMAIVSVNYDWN